MKEIQDPHKIILLAPIKKCGGSAWSVVIVGRHLLTIGFLEAVAPFVPENAAESFLSTHDKPASSEPVFDKKWVRMMRFLYAIRRRALYFDRHNQVKRRSTPRYSPRQIGSNQF